ncbi:hypothetical protein [Thermaerobacillus caldiproteolyticus]|nr:hypothetical protein [Anoxybacillus caldiproteolyticus]QPA32905.1 hypothetical protein ISX45_08465 [Anoxybacillus caldiproteolyticus]
MLEQAFYEDVKQQAEANGRSREEILMFLGTHPIVGATTELMEEKYK